jgi:hypothetical protein
MSTTSSQITFDVKESPERLEDWVVGAVDYASEGEIYIAIFAGIEAEERAREYAAWKNGQEHPTAWGRQSSSSS